MAFTPKVSKARFALSRYSGQQMLSFGDALAESIKARISRGETIYDTPAPPLKEKYARYKLRRMGSGLRDWRYTGRTMRALRPLRANENRVVVGFSDPGVQVRVAVNNRRSRQFGMSPRDRSNIARVITSMKFVRVVRKVA